MNIVECNELVAKIFSVDGRELNSTAQEAWFSAIGHLNRDLAGQAAKACLQEQATRVMPAHVVAKAKEMVKDKAARKIEVSTVKGEPCPTCTHQEVLIDCKTCSHQLAVESMCRHNQYPIYCETCQPHFQRLSWVDWMKLKQVI